LSEQGVGLPCGGAWADEASHEEPPSEAAPRDSETKLTRVVVPVVWQPIHQTA
jgi:hypothetical protein